MKRTWMNWRVPVVFGVALVMATWFLLAKPLKVTALPNTPVTVSDAVVVSPESTPSSTVIEEKIFGYSTAGRPISGYVIGSGEHHLLLFGAIHASERGTVELLNKLAEEIKALPDSVAKNKQIIVIPLLNPDGYYDRSDKLNAQLVNLNLNFATDDWRKYAFGYFAGTTPFSEKESQVLRTVAEQYQPELMLAFHARGALVNPERDEASQFWAQWYANKTSYTYFNGWDYTGTATKWFTQTTGHPALTIELTDYKNSDWLINRSALWELVTEEDSVLPN